MRGVKFIHPVASDSWGEQLREGVATLRRSVPELLSLFALFLILKEARKFGVAGGILLYELAFADWDHDGAERVREAIAKARAAHQARREERRRKKEEQHGTDDV